MAKTANSVKKAKPVSSRKSARKARPQKKTATRKTPSSKATAKKAARTTRKASRTRVGAIAELLPASVGGNEYINRTLKILEQDEVRRARSRAQRAKQLGQVVTDIQGDISERITAVEESTVQTFEDLAERVRSTTVVRTATQLPEQVTNTVTTAVDQLLVRVGLVRKARFDQAVAALPPARRRRVAA